jgi:2-polyprenyl-6-methoxyphenol hydroxylase-like FAD-dependent oxidoreductase
MPAWSSHRVALVGDAAWCPSPLTGMGTSVAMIGAKILADALATSNHREAFAGYELALRHRVAEIQSTVKQSLNRLVPIN